MFMCCAAGQGGWETADLLMVERSLGSRVQAVFVEVVHRVWSSLLGAVDPSFRALSGRLKFTVRRHKFNKDSLVQGGFLGVGRDHGVDGDSERVGVDGQCVGEEDQVDEHRHVHCPPFAHQSHVHCAPFIQSHLFCALWMKRHAHLFARARIASVGG